MKKMSTKMYITVALFLIVIFNFIITQYDFFPVIKKAFNPVVLGFVIAYFLDPIVRTITKISKGKMKRGFAILISVIVVISMIVLFGAILIPSVIQSAEDIVIKIEGYLTSGEFNVQVLERLVNQVDNKIVLEVVTYINESLKEILLKVGELSTYLVKGIVTVAQTTLTSIVNIFMAFVIGLYMLGDKKDLLRRIKKLNYAINNKETADALYDVVKKSDEIFSSFFIGKIIDSAIIGSLCFVIMWIFKIPNAPAIGFIIGITNIIPYFGPFIGAIPAILVTIASGTGSQVLIVLIIILVLQQLDGLIIGPKILGDKVGVGAFWIIVSVTVGGSLFGLVGMFVGVPVVVLIKTLIEEYVEKQLKKKEINIK